MASRWSGWSLGELGAGVYGVFLALELPGVFPILAFAKAGGLVAQNGKEGNRFVIDKGVDEGSARRRRGLWYRVRRLAGSQDLCGPMSASLTVEMRAGSVIWAVIFSGIVHAAIEVKVAF